MAEIHKLKKNNKTILPVTTTEAVVDPVSNKTLNDVLKSFESKEQKNKVNGYPGLDANGKILKSQLPDNFQPTSEKGRANGYPALDANGLIPDAQIPNTVERVGNKNKANGYTGLDADGMLDNRQVRKAFGYRMYGGNTVSVKNDIDFSTTDFTFEFIFNKGSNSKDWLFFQPTTTGAYFGIQISEYNNIVIDQGIAYISGVIKLNHDSHLLYSKTGNTFSVYVDGEKVSEVTKDNIAYPAANTNIVLSQYSAINQNFKIQLFRLYKRGFTQYDVDYYYNAGRPDISRLTYSDKINKATTGCVLELLPENATPRKWLDTQNSLDGVISGNPVINYGNCIPEPCIEPFKKYIGLEQNGDGTGISSFVVKTSKSGKINIIGGIFTNNDGSISLGRELSIFKGITTTIYVKLESSVGEMSCDNMVSFEVSSVIANSPKIRIYTFDFPLTFSTGSGVSKIYGSLQNLPRDMEYLTLSVINTQEYTTGKYEELPRSLYFFKCYTGNKINGDIKYLPNVSSLYLYNTTSETIGSLANLSSNIKYLVIGGNAIITGDISSIKGSPKVVEIVTNSNFTYTNGLVVYSIFDTFRIRPSVGVFTSEMTDQLLIDLAAQITSFVGSKTIDLTGNCGPATAVSSAARSYLSGLGATVLVNS